MRSKGESQGSLDLHLNSADEAGCQIVNYGTQATEYRSHYTQEDRKTNKCQNTEKRAQEARHVSRVRCGKRHKRKKGSENGTLEKA